MTVDQARMFLTLFCLVCGAFFGLYFTIGSTTPHATYLLPLESDDAIAAGAIVLPMFLGPLPALFGAFSPRSGGPQTEKVIDRIIVILPPLISLLIVVGAIASFVFLTWASHKHPQWGLPYAQGSMFKGLLAFAATIFNASSMITIKQLT